MGGTSGLSALRRAILAAAVVHDVDLEPRDDGVTLPGDPPVAVSWAEIADTVRADDPTDPDVVRRVAAALRVRRLVADLPTGELAGRLHPLGLPIGSPGHPGAAWRRFAVLGGALDLGFGLALDDANRQPLAAVPDPLLAAAGVDLETAWAVAVAELDRMSELAAARLRRDDSARLRPMGRCDIVTLLGSRRFRTALVAESGGLRAIAVPMRTRGWADLSLIDPAFTPAAYAATAVAERGFHRALLVTAVEVVMSTDRVLVIDLSIY